MKTRSVRQVFIQPKIFHSIGFHHQGTYQIRIQLIHQKNNKQKQYAYPQYINYNDKSSLSAQQLQDPLNKQSTIKTPCFLTQKFNIDFNDQTYSIKNGVVFHIQFQNEENLTYLNIDLIKIEKQKKKTDYKQIKISKNPQQQKTSTQQEIVIKPTNIQDQKHSKNEDKHKSLVEKTRIVAKKRMFINVSLKQSNKIETCFQKIFFSRSQFYSCMYFFIEHIKLYQKIRLNQYQINQFKNKDPHKKQKLIEKAKLLRNKNELSQQYFLSPFNFKCSNIQQVYTKIMIEPLLQYNYLSTLYKQLNLIYTIFSKTDNSFFSRIQDQQEEDKVIIRKPKKLDYIIPFQNWKTNYQRITIRNLKQKYSIQNDSELLSQWYQQSLLIGQNNRYVWRKCVNLVNWINNQNFLKHCIQANQGMNMRYFETFQLLQKDTIGKKWTLLLQQHSQRRLNFFKKQKYYFSGKLRYPLIIVSKKFNQISIKEQKLLMTHQVLTFFVHGYKGSQFDISKMKANLCQYFNSNFYVLRSIQKIMEENIEVMGQAASKQVLQYLDSKPFVKRVNFVGFSLGGIIIRSLIQRLKQIKPKLNVLITFASPHLGVSKVNHCIVKLGICCMAKIGKIKNMQELHLTDKRKQIQQQNEKQQQNQKQSIALTEEAYLMKLSKSEALSWLKHVILIGSQSDQYVPSYSSMLEYNGDDQKILSMQLNIEKKVLNLHKVNVWLDTKENIFDLVSRRKGHISFLQNDGFLDFFFARYWKLL